jgi:hypothetical protein
MARAYDKNRSQMFSVMDEMELAVHGLKNAREKMNVKHLGNLTHVEKEMDDLYGFLSGSGGINFHKLHSARGSLTSNNTARAPIPATVGSSRGKSMNACNDPR